MKTVLFGLLSLALASSAFASPGDGLSPAGAQNAVLSAAHRFIARNAPDWGGSVHSPCSRDLNMGTLTVTCSGVAKLTTGGDGEDKRSFSCVGVFDQGQDAVYFQNGAIRCNNR